MPLVYTTADVAEILGVTTGAIEMWSREGWLRPFMDGLGLYAETEIERFLGISPDGECEKIPSETEALLNSVQ